MNGLEHDLTVGIFDTHHGEHRQAERRRGRPPLPDSEALRSSVTVKFPSPIHDRLLKLAELERKTLVEFLRDLAITELHKHQFVNPALR